MTVGAGDGSIAEWLCQQMGPRGRAVATDIDARSWMHWTIPILKFGPGCHMLRLPFGTRAGGLLQYVPEVSVDEEHKAKP